MNNPVWEWLVRSKLSAYAAAEKFAPSDQSRRKTPGWCFARMGQSTTRLPDGREVLIAGEHEDYYDPDFCIYNDVVVRAPNGDLEIFGYPREVFAPTDFHSATLVGERILIIGSLGYVDERRPGLTPVMALDTSSFAIVHVPTSGTPPGWIHEHSASLSDDGRSIVVRGGKLERAGDDGALIENIDDWRLCLEDSRWERLTERRWARWRVVRQDGKRNHLWAMEQVSWSREMKRKTWKKEFDDLAAELGRPPDLEQRANLYEPACPHTRAPKMTTTSACSESP
jgi:hypothetical protein